MLAPWTPDLPSSSAATSPLLLPHADNALIDGDDKDASNDKTCSDNDAANDKTGSNKDAADDEARSDKDVSTNRDDSAGDAVTKGAKSDNNAAINGDKSDSNAVTDRADSDRDAITDGANSDSNAVNNGAGSNDYNASGNSLVGKQSSSWSLPSQNSSPVYLQGGLSAIKRTIEVALLQRSKRLKTKDYTYSPPDDDPATSDAIGAVDYLVAPPIHNHPLVL